MGLPPIKVEGMTVRSSSSRKLSVKGTNAAVSSGNVTVVPRPNCIPIAPNGGVTRPLKTSEVVARNVARDIIEGGLQTGDGLPPEAVMLKQYGVSRESLREGLRLLEVQGLITIRRGPGGGPVVGTVDPTNLGRVSTLYYYLAGASYRELFEAWVLSEGTLAELAALNPDAEARRAMLSPYLDPNSAPQSEDELEAFMTPHLLFHSAIARLVNNRVLELMLRTSGQIASHHFAVTDDPRHLAATIDRDHLALAKAIIAGQSKKARRLMEDHIRSVADANVKHLGSKVDDLIEWI